MAVEVATLAGLAAVVHWATQSPTSKQKVKDLTAQSMGESMTSFMNEYALEDKLRGQSQQTLSGYANVDVGTFAAGYVPSGRAPMGSRLDTTTRVNSRNQAIWQATSFANAVRTRTTSIDQSNVHHPVQLMGSLTESSIHHNPRARAYPFRYSYDRSLVEHAEEMDGSSRNPDFVLTGFPSTYAIKDPVSLDYTSDRTVQVVNPYARRGQFSELARGKPVKRFNPNDRDTAFVGQAAPAAASAVAFS